MWNLRGVWNYGVYFLLHIFAEQKQPFILSDLLQTK